MIVDMVIIVIIITWYHHCNHHHRIVGQFQEYYNLQCGIVWNVSDGCLGILDHLADESGLSQEDGWCLVVALGRDGSGEILEHFFVLCVWV